MKKFKCGCITNKDDSSFESMCPYHSIQILNRVEDYQISIEYDLLQDLFRDEDIENKFREMFKGELENE